MKRGSFRQAGETRANGASRRQVLAGAGLASGFACIPADLLAAPYHPAGLYKPQEAAAALEAVTVTAPAGLKHLHIGVTSNPRTWPIIDGGVRADGVDVQVTTGAPGELFYRQLTRGEFDASEISTSFMMIQSVAGDDRFIPIPVFTSRYFFHSLTLVRRGANITKPADLRGKRVGVPEYMMTGALWTRGVFQDEFGIRPQDIEWWVERMADANQGNALGRGLPPDVHIKQIPAEKNVGEMMLAGELDAAIMYIWARKPTPSVRSTINLYDAPEITTLFPDPISENKRYFAKTGIHHINHCALVKRDLAKRVPGVEKFVFEFFNVANKLADTRRQEALEYYFDLGLLDEAAKANIERPLTPYGYQANKATMDALARYSFEQGLIKRRVDMSKFFAV